ncbi:conserved hypothetical protein [Pyrenophora tritici-repentis Pt-1C-BFP]|uniref:Zn(2)-C6 fungal-type domain-containing protein n=1 Tax=Pyrenophora tritici-repentis (strain Pt-1C-BFP) TaxID=426418 RepID=B2W6J2_PYRTR|nr:uncharacterized protein PTRG_05430 [Pyrenophora tritici-repentis Pt-1C-BFP]EDU48350.1 conserved hypothetical protein [Pyrenophora tritici-repentis Pt-1C-BFP]
MADGGMLPMAEVGFDFILPHGIDTDDDVATSEINAYKSANPSPDHEMMEDIQQTSKPDDGLAITEANVDQHEASFDMLQERFPEDVCASEAPNCSGSEVPKNKKSRRTDDDEQDNNERSKKPRQSLFGPQMEDPEGDGLDDLFEEQPGDLLNQENDMNEPGIPETVYPSRQNVEMFSIPQKSSSTDPWLSTLRLRRDNLCLCEHCRDEGDECQLIVPATRKGSCKQCVDGNDYCSFEDEPDQIICDNCLNRVHICHALPPEGYRNDRISIDEIMYGENKRHIACTSCRQGKKRCSLKKKTDKPPCKNCKKNEIGCTFYDIPKKAPKKKASKGKRPAKDDSPEPTPLSHAYFTAEDLEDLNNTDQRIISRSPTPEIELEDTAGHRGVLTKINTSFSHPIKFGMIENTSDCNFCELPIYSFVGLFEKEVHVICWENGQGYTEVGGGHMEKNGPTTMCQYCTTSFRGTISGFEEALYDLFEFADEPYEIKKQLQQWCSMCFSPAAFACRTRQAAFLSPDDTRELIDGCGLKLCTRCEEQLREVFGGDSSVMAATLDLEPKAKELDNDVQGLVIRADVGFLSSEGILMKNLEYELEKKRLQNEADEGNI